MVSCLAIHHLDGKGKRDRHHRHFPRQHGPGYTVTPLVSDQPYEAPVTDPKLVNAWGITAGPTTPWWVANQGTNSSTLYDGNGVIQGGPLVVTIGTAGNVPFHPTGIVFNGKATDFMVTPTGGSASRPIPWRNG